MTPAPDEQRHGIASVQYREATEHDAKAIATLHADSWRRHYRGAYLDSYLDGDVVSDRIAVWEERLAPPRHAQSTICAVDGSEVVGFAHTLFDQDPVWGSLLDNLHVQSGLKRNGIGTCLLSAVAQVVLGHSSPGSFHLWVLDQNRAAQTFYEARGGQRVETQLRGPFPGGGTALGHRYYWSDPGALVI